MANTNNNNLLNLKELDNLSPEERQIALQILQQYAESGQSKIYNNLKYADYEEIPVDIITFMDDPQYLGTGLINPDTGKSTVFPYWRELAKKIYPDNIEPSNYNTLALSGSIGLGKSFIAVVLGLYDLYRTLCLKDPYAYYGLQQIDLITYAFINITIDAARGVAWDKCQQLLQSSPWFMAHGTLEGRTNVEWVPPKGIELIAGSQSRHIIGRAVKWCFIDEVSFQPNQDINKQVEKAKTLVNTAAARMQSRFMKGEYNPTLLVLASSKRTEASFMEQYIEGKKKLESKTTYIVDEPQWVVRTDKDSPNKFWVAIGNKYLNSEVVPLNTSEEELDIYRRRGYKLLHVPMGYYEQFIEDIDIALTDIAGISTSSSNRYFNGPRIATTINDDLKNLFIREVIEVGDGPDDKTQYYEFIDLERLDVKLKSRPLYIHLDMSISGDKTGIVGTWIVGKKPPQEGQPDEKTLLFRVAFAIAIKAPKGHQVSFQKNLNFIYWLKEQGFNIKGVTSDTFQNAYVGQALTAHKFNYSILSVDRLEERICKPYQYLRTIIYDENIQMFNHKLLIDELIGLERDNNSGKIDHSTSGINSKDVADALCGSVFRASQDASQYAFDYGEDLDHVVKVSSNNSYEAMQQQISDEFQAELQKMFDPVLNRSQPIQSSTQPQQQQNIDKTQPYIDFGLGKAQNLQGQNAHFLSQGIVIPW